CVALELGELERPRADRLDAHVPVRHVAGVDGRQPRGQHRQYRWLRLGQVERRLVVAVERDLLEVLVPDPARIAPQILGLLAVETMPRALHVLGGEWLAVVPGHALAQLES